MRKKYVAIVSVLMLSASTCSVWPSSGTVVRLTQQQRQQIALEREAAEKKALEQQKSVGQTVSRPKTVASATKQTKQRAGAKRSIPGKKVQNTAQDETVTFGKVVYAAQPQPTLFFGTESMIVDADLKRFALTRVRQGDCPDSAGRRTVLVEPFDRGEAFAGNVVTDMSLFGGQFPAVLLQNDTKAYLCSNEMILISPEFSDAAGNQTNEAVAIAATNEVVFDNNSVFVAVSENGKTFATQTNAADGVERGIGLARRGGAGLSVRDVDSVSSSDMPRARRIETLQFPDNVANDRHVAFVSSAPVNDIIARAELSGASLHWDNRLRRLYIGLNGVRRDDQSKEGGVLGLLVGRFVAATATDPEMFVIEPFVKDVTRAHFYDNTAADKTNIFNRIVGAYLDGLSNTTTHPTDGDIDVGVSFPRVRTMHASTGKSYLIAQGITQAQLGSGSASTFVDQTRDKIYALPLIDTSETDETKKGKLRGVGPTKVPVATTMDTPVNLDNMLADTDAPAVVGKDAQFFDGTYVQDLYVEGDAVYVTLIGPDNQTSGIFQSNALFDCNGFIRAWTPWTRVMGDVRRVQGMGIDRIRGNFYYLTTDSHTTPTQLLDFCTARVTGWGSSELLSPENEDGQEHNLSSQLASIFSSGACGVQQLFAFDDQTPGFDKGRFTMVAAISTNKLALIQTGKFESGRFSPVKTYHTSGDDQNIFVFDDQVLKDIAPLTCVEVARLEGTGEGWLFVSGLNGVAVLADATTGAGWDAVTGLLNLSAGGFPKGNFVFKKLTPSTAGNSFTYATRLRARDGYLYVMTMDSLFAVELNVAKFASPANVLAEEKLQLTNLPADALLSDFLPIREARSSDNSRGILTTTKGLFATKFGTNPTAQPVTVNGKNLGVLAPMSYVSQTRGQASEKGNVYVIEVDSSCNTGKLYRFDVDGALTLGTNSIKAIKNSDMLEGPFLSLGEYRFNITNDGSFIFHTLPRDFKHDEFLNMNAFSLPTITRQLTPLLDVNQECSAVVGRVVREPASGALLVPGDWGVRLNQ